MQSSTQEIENPTDSTTIDFEPKVILFNDEIHSFDEVINQIQKAISCSRDQAETLTLEVHTTGKALVYSGEMIECLKVVSVLEEIGLHTTIEM